MSRVEEDVDMEDMEDAFIAAPPAIIIDEQKMTTQGTESLVSSLVSRVKFLEDQNQNFHEQNMHYQKELQKVRKSEENYKEECEKLKMQIQSMMGALNKRFSPAQLKIILEEAIKPQWDDDVLQKSFTIISNAGERNYQMMRQFLPLPAPSTVYNHLRTFSSAFEPGLLDINIEIMKLKYDALNLPPVNKYCLIGMDAKQIVTGIQVNPSTKERVGIATVEPSEKSMEKNPEDMASQAVIFLAMGLDPRVKEVVGYELTTDSSNPESLKEKLFRVLREIEQKAGVKVRFLNFKVF